MSTTTPAHIDAPGSVGGFPASQRWDAGALLAMGVFVLVLRVPLGMALLGIASVIVLVLQGFTYRRGFGILTAFTVVALLTSTLTLAMAPGNLMTSYFLLAFSGAAFTAAMLFSGSLQRNLKLAIQGMYVGLWTHFVISLGELVSGVKILPLRAPTASTAPVVAENPWIVTSLFINYNDYSVAMVIFVNLLVAKLLFSRGTAKPVIALQLAAAFMAMFLIVVIGSRGALLALIATFLIQVFLTVRVHYSRWLTTRVTWGFLGVGAVAGVILWQTPYIQTHSTLWRIQIAESITALFMSNPIAIVFGFGSQDAFDKLGRASFPGQLLNPHNVVLEVAMAFGVIAMVLAVGAWLVILYRSLIKLHVPLSADGWAAVTVALAIAPTGTVPSGFLDYGYPMIGLVSGSIAVWLKRDSLLLAAPHDEHGGGRDAGEQRAESHQS